MRMGSVLTQVTYNYKTVLLRMIHIGDKEKETSIDIELLNLCNTPRVFLEKDIGKG